MMSMLIAGMGLTAQAATAPLSDVHEQEKTQLEIMIEKDGENLSEQLEHIDDLLDGEEGREGVRRDLINKIGVAFMTKGFEDIHNATFSELKDLSIEAPEGTTLSVLVINESGDYIYDEKVSAGAFNMMDMTIPFDEGLNSIIIIVNMSGEEYARLYTMNRKPIEIKEELEALDITNTVNTGEPIINTGD